MKVVRLNVPLPCKICPAIMVQFLQTTSVTGTKNYFDNIPKN